MCRRQIPRPDMAVAIAASDGRVKPFKEEVVLDVNEAGVY